MADRVARRIRSHRHPLALDRMPPDRPLDRHAVARDFALDDREVSFFDAAILELPRKRGARKRRPRHNHHARRVLVEAMHDAGSQHAVRLGHRSQLGKSREESVHERAVGMPGRGMHRHPGRLVNDDYFVVVENHRNLRRVPFLVNSKDRSAPAGIAATSTRSPVRTPLDARAAAPLTVTSPALIIRATCEREYSGARRIETNTSSRMRSCSAPAVIVVGRITSAIYRIDAQITASRAAESAADRRRLRSGVCRSGPQFSVLVVAITTP